MRRGELGGGHRGRVGETWWARGLAWLRTASFTLAWLGGLNMTTIASAEASPADEFKRGRAAQGEARRAHFLKGMEQARALVDKNPKDPEGLFWLAVNMGAEALERGKMSALPVVPKMERLLLKVDELEPGFAEGGAARVLGRLYDQAPAVVSVGSSSKARKFLERALKLAPEHPGNQAFAADFLKDNGERERAKKLAASALATLEAAGDKYGDEGKEWRKIARDVMDD